MVQFVLTTSKDSSVCPQCSALQGLVFDPEEDVPDIPVHGNCRCRYILFNETDKSIPSFIPDSLT